MDPRAWLLKVLIVRMDLQQKDPTVFARSLPPDHPDLRLWRRLRSILMKSSRTNGDRLPLAFETALLDAQALFSVILGVDKNDNLREVLARALRSIREALLQAGASYQHINDFYLFIILKFNLRPMIASNPGSKQDYADASESDSELASAYTFHAFLTSVLHLLTFVFQYLIGYVDRGGSKTYSSGAFDFRASFVALVLFQGAYVWIKFRETARPDCRKRKAPHVVDIVGLNLKGLHKRSIKNASGDFVRFKYEPRFTPPRQEGDDGTNVCSKLLPLGEYHTPAEAQIVRQIARYYYDKDGGCVELKYGLCKRLIPSMSEEDRGLAGEPKRDRVIRTAKRVGKQMYADFQREKGKQVDMANEAGSQGVGSNDPPSSARPLPCSSLPVLTAMVGEPVHESAAASLPSVPLLPSDGASMGDADDFSEDPSAIQDMIEVLFCDLVLPNPLDQQLSVVSYQVQHQGLAQLPGGPSLSDVGAAPGVIEHDSEPENLNRSPSFHQRRDLAVAGTENMDGRVFLPQSVPDLQQLLLCQKKCLGDYAKHFVDLDHQLKACQIQNSRLQLEKEQLQQENESLKIRLQQVAEPQVATWNGIVTEMQQRD